MKWFRLYSEARNDAKLRHLQDDEHRVWFNLMCFANEQKDDRGSIPCHSYTLLAIEVANGDESLLQRTLEKLAMLRIIEDKDGIISFINFNKRQYDNPSDQPEEVRKRVQKHRSKNCNDNETTTKRKVTTHNTDTDTDIEKDLKDKTVKNAPPPYQDIVSAYNETCKSLPKVRQLTDSRRKHIKARWEQLGKDKAVFDNAFNLLEASDFCKGDNDRKWKADFDWVMQNETNIIKVLEGKYNNDRMLNGKARGDPLKDTCDDLNAKYADIYM